MSNKYNEVMNKIEVTEEMRSRILQNIANEFSENNVTGETTVETPIDFASRAKDRKKSVYSFTRYIGVAAAAVVLLIGATAVLDNKNNGALESTNSFAETAQEFTQGAAADLHKESEFIKNSWVKYDSVEKMAQATGNDYKEIEYLNDISSDVDYYLDGGDVATIVYDVSGNAITVTQSQQEAVETETFEATPDAEMAPALAKADNSDGKADAPKAVSQTVTVNGVDVRFDGTEDGLNKASWTVDGIEYSMNSAEKLSLDEMTELMNNILR